MVAAPEYSVEVQAKIVLALCALHNFIRIHDQDDLFSEEEELETTRTAPERQPEDYRGYISEEERSRASTKRDEIAHAMWAQYVAYTTST